MKIKAKFVMVLSIIGIFNCMVLPVVNAETFDVGEKVTENDFGWYTFSSGVVVKTSADYISYAPLIIDGNESTGINHDFGPGHEYMSIHIYFPYSYNVSDITVKPAFGGNASIYSFDIRYKTAFKSIASDLSDQKTFQINCTIDSINLDLDSNGTNHFYFNDMIINYTPIPPTNIDELQEEINNISAQLNALNLMLNELNNSINTLNLTQQEIENVTNLLGTYNQLNESFTNLTTDIENFDSRVFQLESENVALKNEIGNLTTEIESLSSEIETLKSTEKEIIIKKQPDNSLVYAALILGILGLLIAIIAIILVSKKSGSQKPSTEAEAMEQVQRPPQSPPSS